MKIPEARSRLSALAGYLRASPNPDVKAAAAEIDEIVAGMFRERYKLGRAAAENHAMDAARADAIRHFNQRHPQVSVQVIAARFGVNPGRVSEALAGRWT